MLERSSVRQAGRSGIEKERNQPARHSQKGNGCLPWLYDCSGTASQATPQGRRHCANATGGKVGFELAASSSMYAPRPAAGQPILGRRFGARRRRLLRWGFICCWLQKDALRPKQSSADQQPSEAREERGSWLRHRYSTRHEEEMGEDVRPKSRKWR